MEHNLFQGVGLMYLPVVLLVCYMYDSKNLKTIDGTLIMTLKSHS